MVPSAPLQSAVRAVGSAGLAGRKLTMLCSIGISHGFGKTVLRLAVALLCIGLALQALSNAADPYRCGALVKHGSWPPYTRPSVDVALAYEQLEALREEGRELPPARSFEKWQPAGCRMHEYSRDDIRDCLGGKRILFVGDSTARILFFAALTRLEHEAAEWLLRTTFVDENPRHDLSIDSESIQLDFMWDPWLNSSAFVAEIGRMRPGGDAAGVGTGPELLPKPNMIVVGSPGLWAARNAGDKFLDTFRSATDRVALAMGDTVRPFAEDGPANHIFLAPVTIPRYELLPPGRAEALSPNRIKSMNDYLGSLPTAVQSHILTAFNEMTYHVPEAYEDTGLHVSDAVAERWIDIPLNARCNGLLARPGKETGATEAYKTTCCVAYPGMVRGQRYLFFSICAAIITPLILLLFKKREISTSCFSFSVLGLAVLYCYMADRSHAFSKSEKRYSEGWLYFSLIASSVVFISSLRHVQPQRGTAPKDDDGALPQRKTQLEAGFPFLPRHVSDEWKGLMQAAFLLLAYHDGTEKPIPTNWSEFVTSSFLFLSAYGHASYFLGSSDYSLRRVASVLFRLNALPYLLSVMLDGLASGTQSSVSHLYNFPRLVSFWFLVTYTTLRVASRKDGVNPDILLTQLCASTIIVVYGLSYMGKYGFFESVGRAGLYFFRAEWSVDDMRKVVSATWCAPFCGMAVATVAQRANLISDQMERLGPKKVVQNGQQRNEKAKDGWGAAGNGSSWLDRLLVGMLYPNEYTEPLKPMFILFCFVFFFAFACMASFSASANGEVGHPYSTSIAVVCFAVVRNGHGKLRGMFLQRPAVLGTIALELFVFHNHIFLSGNGSGRLRLFSIYARQIEGNAVIGSFFNARVAVIQLLEVVSIATVFIAVSWRAHLATRTATAVIFGQDMEHTVSGMAKAKYSTDEEDALPHYDDGSSKPNTSNRLGRWASDTRFRAACVLILFWSWSRFYI